MYAIQYKDVDLEVKGNYHEAELGDYCNPGYLHYFESEAIFVFGTNYNIVELLSTDDISKIEELVLETYYE